IALAAAGPVVYAATATTVYVWSGDAFTATIAPGPTGAIRALAANASLVFAATTTGVYEYAVASPAWGTLAFPSGQSALALAIDDAGFLWAATLDGVDDYCAACPEAGLPHWITHHAPGVKGMYLGDLSGQRI